MSKEAIKTLMKTKKKLEADLTTLLSVPVKKFYTDTGVGIGSISVHMVDITCCGDLTYNYVVGGVSVELALRGEYVT